MKGYLLAVLCVSALILGCSDTTALRRPHLLASEQGCPGDGSGGEIFGYSNSGVHYPVKLTAVHPESQKYLLDTMQTAGVDCANGDKGEWGWSGVGGYSFCDDPAQSKEQHSPYSGPEKHCILPGRFDVDAGYFTGPVDWTSYSTVAGSVRVEDPAALNGGQIINFLEDVIINAGESYTTPLYRRVHVDIAADAYETTWDDQVIEDTIDNVADTLLIEDPSWIRIGAWDAMAGEDRRLLVRYLWTEDGVESSGYAPARAGGGLHYARVRHLPAGCRSIRVMFRLTRPESPQEDGELELRIPVRVGPTCNPATPSGVLSVTVAASGSGTVGSNLPGIFTTSFASEVFNLGTTVSLWASAAHGHTFANWSGCTSATGTSCSVTISGNHAITASFTENPVWINGPTSFVDLGKYTWWAAGTFGDPAANTYEWYYKPNGGSEQLVSTANFYRRTLTSYVAFRLRLVVTHGSTSMEVIQWLYAA